MNEPDLTERHFGARLIGKAAFTSGEVRWYGPNGRVVDLPRVPSDARPSDE